MLRGRRWRDLTEVERVGRYTRQSLHLVLWGVNGVALLAAASGDGRGSALVAGGVAVTAAAYLVMRAALGSGPTVGPLPPSRVALLLVLSAALFAVAVTAWDGDVRRAAVLTVVASLSLALGLVPDDRLSVALALLCTALVAISGAAVLGVVFGFVFSALFVFSARASMWLFGIVAELDGARRAQAELAVVGERLRFSRDVHDVLGRRLSTIAVQAELAATLADRGDDRAAAQMLEVRGVAHEALREARELARGYRTTDFAQELDGARSLLRSAGIEVRAAVEGMPRAWHEPAGWVVRESVTNVLRHSQARLVEIDYADGRLRVANDGAGAAEATDGTGLRGLRERLEPLGASLDAHPDGDGRWLVVAALPATGPLSAAAGGDA